MPGRSEFDPLWQRTLSQGKAAPQMQPLAIFPPNLLEQSRERLAPGLDYLQCFNHRNGAPKCPWPYSKPSVSVDLSFGRRARGWGEGKKFPFLRSLISQT